PLGSGIGGGVELTLHSLVLGLTALGHQVEVIAPAGSLQVGGCTHQVQGELQRSSQNDGRDALIAMPPRPVLGAMWDLVRRRQADFDVVLNMAYDWLPLYLTKFLEVPIAHLISMASLNDAVDEALRAVVTAHPGCAAVHSRAQAQSFGDIAGQLRVIGNGIAVERYDMHVVADDPAYLGYVGRISPEKGIDDVFAAAAGSKMPLKVWGLMQDRECWDSAVAAHPTAQVSYMGFLPTDDMQAAIGGCAAILMAPKWVEAFGNVAVEAMACGVPVITYRRGGPAEIVHNGQTGFLVEPDDVAAMADAIGRIPELDRIVCRQLVEEEYSTEALAGRVDEWLGELIDSRQAATGND
ncbi:MAG: glycosyltransferase family 4 protein, partial [Ilumatobacteraceae bacterium]